MFPMEVSSEAPLERGILVEQFWHLELFLWEGFERMFLNGDF